MVYIDAPRTFFQSKSEVKLPGLISKSRKRSTMITDYYRLLTSFVQTLRLDSFCWKSSKIFSHSTLTVVKSKSGLMSDSSQHWGQPRLEKCILKHLKCVRLALKMPFHPKKKKIKCHTDELMSARWHCCYWTLYHMSNPFGSDWVTGWQKKKKDNTALMWYNK